MTKGEKLRLGKGAAFVKSRLKRLPQVDETWEADFQALPKPIMQTETHYLGMVVTKKGGSLLADLPVHARPSVNDLATLLAHAMRRPLDGIAPRPGGGGGTGSPAGPGSSVCGGTASGGSSSLSLRNSASGCRSSGSSPT